MADRTRQDANAPAANDYGAPQSEIADLIAALAETMTARGTRGPRPQPDAGAGTAAIKAAFDKLWQELDLTGPAKDANDERLTLGGQHADATSDDFVDIRAAFSELRQAIGLPGQSPDNLADHADGAAAAEKALQELDAAAAEAQACARWYSQAPEWQRISRVGDAARILMATIRETAGDYWAEVRQDIRVRGFARTVAARVSRAIAVAAGALARTMERSGGPARASKAAHWLHRSAATFADTVMSYVAPGSNQRMEDVALLIDRLQRGQPEPRSSGTRRRQHGRSAPLARPASLARASFPRLLASVTGRSFASADGRESAHTTADARRARSSSR